MPRHEDEGGFDPFELKGKEKLDPGNIEPCYPGVSRPSPCKSEVPMRTYNPDDRRRIALPEA
jgi:hypothetical protein